MNLWLDPIREPLRTRAAEELAAGDWLGFLVKADNQDSVWLVYMNAATLKHFGVYEPALLHALTISRVNNHHIPMNAMRTLVQHADREKLRAAGDPLPGPGPFTVYRGVAGRGRARRVRGLAWTASLEKARWFAQRGGIFQLEDPGVYQVVVPEDRILAYTDDRKEQEFLVRLAPGDHPERIESLRSD